MVTCFQLSCLPRTLYWRAEGRAGQGRRSRPGHGPYSKQLESHRTLAAPATIDLQTKPQIPFGLAKPQFPFWSSVARQQTRKPTFEHVSWGTRYLHLDPPVKWENPKATVCRLLFLHLRNPPHLAPSISVAASSSSLECFLEWAQKVATLSRVTRYPVQVIKWGWSLCQAPCWGPAGGSAALKVLSTQADTGLFQLPQDSGWGHPLLSTNIASEYSKAEEEQAPHRWGRRNPSLLDHHCTNSEWTKISRQLIQKSQTVQLKDKQEPEANISAKRRPREVDSHAHG